MLGNSTSGEAMSTSPTSSHMDYMPATSSAPMASGGNCTSGSVSGTSATTSASGGPVRQVAVPPMSSSTSNNQNTSSASGSSSSGNIVMQQQQPLQLQQPMQQQEMAGTSAESTQVRPVLLNGSLISSVTHNHSSHMCTLYH